MIFLVTGVPPFSFLQIDTVPDCSRCKRVEQSFVILIVLGNGRQFFVSSHSFVLRTKHYCGLLISSSHIRSCSLFEGMLYKGVYCLVILVLSSFSLTRVLFFILSQTDLPLCFCKCMCSDECFFFFLFFFFVFCCN